MNSRTTPTNEVSEMGKIDFSGNVIPHSWYANLRFANGNVYLPAIIILAEICWWYRPRYVKDENSGEFIGIEKKFWGDKLQRSYSSFSSIGLSKKQAFDACHYLESKGIITLEVRTVTTKDGRFLPNELFIGIVPEAIKSLNKVSLELPVSNTPLPVGNTPLPVGNTTEITTKDNNIDNNTEDITVSKDKAGKPANEPSNKLILKVKAKFQYEAQAKEIFDDWILVTERNPERNTLTPARKKCIIDLLKSGTSVNDFKLAIRGNLLSRWHMERVPPLDTIENLAKHTDTFERFVEDATKKGIKPDEPIRKSSYLKNGRDSTENDTGNKSNYDDLILSRI